MKFEPYVSYQLHGHKLIYNNNVLLIVNRFSFEGKFSHFLNRGPIGLRIHESCIQMGELTYDTVEQPPQDFCLLDSRFRFVDIKGINALAVGREKVEFGYLEYQYSLADIYLLLQSDDQNIQVTWFNPGKQST